MREYETTFIIQPEISEDGRQELLSRVDGTLERHGATRLLHEDQGRRRLAYEIRNFQKGRYVTTYYLDEGKAVAPLEQAAALDPTGDLYVRLAQVHIQREKWSDATAALSKAISKGKLEAPGDAVLLMGIAYYSNKQPEKARSWFLRAGNHAATRKEAATWVQYVDRELAAQAVADGSATPEAAPEEAASAGAPADAAS